MNKSERSRKNLLKEVKVQKYKLDTSKVKNKKDITELVKTVEALKGSESALRAVFNNSSDAIGVHLNGNWEMCNPATVRLFNYSSPKELIGKSILNVIAPGERTRINEFVEKRTERKDAPTTYVTRGLRKDGTEFDLEVILSSYIFKRKLHTVVLLRDITDRKRIEDALRENEQKFRAAFENAPIGMSMIRPDGQYLAVNPALCKMFGYSEKELLAGTINKITHPDDIERGNQWIRKMISGDRSEPEFEKRYIHKDGHIVWGLVRAEWIKDNTGAVRMSVVHILDITERKLAEEKINKANRIYAVISQINQTIVREKDSNKLFEEVCRIAVEYGKFQMAWIGLIEEKTKLVNPIAFAGAEDGYFSQAVKIYIDDVPEGHGPTGTAIREGKYCVCNDIANDPRMIPWKNEALKRGYHSSISLPLEQFGKIIGSFTLFASSPCFFDNEEIVLLDEVTGDISFALESIETEKKRKIAEDDLRASESRFRELWKATLEGIVIHDKGKILELNDAMCRIFGITREHAIGKMLYDFAPKGIHDLLHDRISSNLEERFEGPATRADGKSLIIEAFANQITYGGKQVKMVAIRDITDRKRAEEALRNSEEKFRKAFTTSPDSININRLEDGLYVSINKGFTNLTGYTEEDIRGKTSIESNIWVDQNERNKLLEGLKRDGRVENLVARFRLKSGEIKYGMMSASIIELDGIQHILSITRDISERKRAEEALQESEERMRAIVEGTPHLFFYTQDSDANITYVSPTVEQITGYTVDTWLTQKDWFLTDAKFNQVAIERTHAHLRGEFTEGPTLIEIRHANGNPILLEGYEYPVIKDAQIVGLQGVVHDITERKRAEEMLVKSENKYRSIFENIQDVYYESTLDGIILEVSPSVQAFTNGLYKREDLVGKSMYDFYSATQERDTFIAELIERKALADYEITLINREGTIIPCSITCKIQFDAEGNPEKVVGTLRNIAVRKQAENEIIKAKEIAERSDKLKSEFLSQMSHEIRTPINVIAGNVDYLKEISGEQIVNENLNIFDGISRASQRIIRTIDLILNMSELQAGAYEPIFSEIDVDSQVLQYLFNEFQRTANEKGIDLVYNCEMGKSLITADEYSITQIFANLIDNAIKYTKKGKVEIFLGKNEDGNIIAEIKDTGIGISKEFLPKIFEPFIQEDHGYTRSYDGSGLGLALVKNYCIINNARIEVESDKNIGSTFRVIFNK